MKLLVLLVLVQFTLVPFLSMVHHNKPAQFRVYGETVIYKVMN